MGAVIECWDKYALLLNTLRIKENDKVSVLV